MTHFQNTSLLNKQSDKEKITNQCFVDAFSLPVSHVCLSRFPLLQSNHKSRLLIKTIPTIEEPDSGAPTNFNPTRRRTHNLKSEALLLIQSNSSMPLSSLFSSNPYSNQWRTHIQSNSAALHLFPDDSATLFLFHSKSVAPPTIFRFSLYI